MNHEGYDDKTADRAITRVMRSNNTNEMPESISFMVKTFKNMANFFGYDISNRITFIDRKTGKEWR